MSAQRIANEPSEPATTPAALGLRGLWALVANSSAVVIVAITMFLGLYIAWTMHGQDRADLLRLIDRGYQQNEQMQKIIDRNSAAVERLADRIERLGKQ